MSAATTETVWAELDELRAQARQADERVAELETEAREAVNNYRRTRAAHLAYLEDVEAGRRETDGDLERDLLDELGELDRRLTIRPATTGSPPEVLDERLRARITGARHAATARAEQVTAFMRRHFDELAAELAREAREAAGDVDAALVALVEAEAGYRRIRARWRPLLAANGLEFDLPANPLRGFADDVPRVGVPVPVPRLAR